MRRFAVRSGIGSAALAALLAGVVAPPPSSAAVEERPWTVPALKEWSGGGPGYTAGPRIAVVLAEESGELADEAEVFADDLSALLGREVPVDPTGPARPGQIELALDPGTGKGEEGYELAVRPVLRISATTELGVWNGTRSVLQMLTQSRRLPGGVAQDWPDYEYRGVSFCNCVTYWSTEYLKRLIRQMSYLKLNVLHVEMMVELDGFPEFDTWSRPRYTPKQARELVAYAERYRVRLIPQVNFPGHAEYHLQGHPDLVLADDDGPSESNVDMGNPDAYAHMRAVLEQTAEVFGRSEFHAGGDEYLPSKADFEAYPSLVRWARELVGPDAAAAEVMPLHFNWAQNEVFGPAGTTMYIWNDQLFDGLQTELDSDIVVEHWFHFEGRRTPKQIAANGNRLVNAHVNLYMVGAPTSGNDWVYEEFRVHEFHGGDVLDPDDPLLLGAELAVWPPREQVSELDLEPALNRRMYPFASVVWGGPRLAPTYEEFEPIAEAVGLAPGYRTSATVAPGTYVLENAETGRVLALAPMPGPDGRFPSLVQADADGGAEQRWTIDNDEQGRSMLRNVAVGACVVVESTDRAETDALLGDCGGERTLFYLQPVDDGGHLVRSMPSGQLLTPVDDTDGGNVRQEPFAEERPQTWRLRPASASVAVVTDDVVVGVVPDEPRTLAFTVTNPGELPAFDIEASFDVPEGVRAEPSSPTWRYLGPGDERLLSWRVTMPKVVRTGAPAVLSLRYRQGGRTHTAGVTVWFDPANLALGRVAEQSTTEWDGTADRAVDGDTDGTFGNGSVTHTADGTEDQPWWQVDLGAEYPIEEIRIWNRTDCCSKRLQDYYVVLADRPITGATVEESLATPGAWYVHETEVAGTPTTVPVPEGQTARYLRIHLDARRALSLAEVEVFPPSE